MKPEILETLLLDRALGELSPEVSALLAAYLAQNPAAASHATALAATLQLAREALATPREIPRALDLARLPRANHATRTTHRHREVLRLAACLALGLVVGWLAQPARPIAAAPAVAILAPPRSAEPATQFWSLAQFAPRAGKTFNAKNR